MTQFTPEAQRLRDEYFRRIRGYVSVVGGTTVEDVLGEVQGHLDQELQGVSQPVSGECLSAVLKRLGEPSSWVCLDDLPWWRRGVLRAGFGPENWRLAYVTFALFVVGILGGMIFGWLWWAPFLAVSFVTARAAMISVVLPASMPLGQKWLIYPTLIAVYILLAVVVLAIVPLFIGAATFVVLDPRSWHSVSGPMAQTLVEEIQHWRPDQETLAILVGISAALATAGIWWILLACLYGGWVRRFLEAVFHPFFKESAEKLRRVGLVAGVAMAVLAFLCMVLRKVKT
jgi:hypothetical protein